MIIYFTPSSQILVFSLFDFKSLLIQNEKNGIYFNFLIFFVLLITNEIEFLLHRIISHVWISIWMFWE